MINIIVPTTNAALIHLNSESRETTKKICVVPMGDVRGALEYQSVWARTAENRAIISQAFEVQGTIMTKEIFVLAAGYFNSDAEIKDMRNIKK